MALNDQYRINKDTSARKGPALVDLKAAADFQALLAGHKAKEGFWEAHFNKVELDHEQRIRDLDAKHQEEIRTKCVELEDKEKTAQQCQSKAVSDAVAKERQETEAKMNALQKQIKKLGEEKTLLNQQIKQQSNTIKGFEDRESKMLAKITAHPKSWIQISFKHTNYPKERDYFQKYNETLQNAAKGLRKNIRRETDVILFKHKGQLVDPSKTLEELGIGEGAKLSYEFP